MELASAITLFLVLYLSCLVVMSAKKKMSSRGKMPPGPTPLPIIGNFLQIKAAKTYQSLLKLREKYGPVFTVYFGTRPIVVLCGHDVVKEALIDRAEEFSGRKTMPTLERTFQEHGVVFANGERWRQLRRFSLTILRNFGMGKKTIEQRIQEEAQFLLEEFQKTKEKPFDPTFYLSCSVSNVICSIVFGDRFDYEDKEFLALMQMMNESFREMSTAWSQFYDIYASFLRYFPGPHTKVYDILEDMRRFIARRVKKNQETLDPNSPRDFIDCFLIQMEKAKDSPDNAFNVKNLELTTLNLFFAGTETVSSTLRYGFLFLMKDPKVQEKMHEEIDRVIGHSRAPNIEDRSKMPYVDAVIHEVQRVSDLIPMNVPHAVTRDTEFRGYVIPKGTEIYPLLGTVLHDDTKFKNPDAFNPENFLDENGHFKKNEAFVPFSSGKRICLGEALARMELFLFFTTILQRFQLKPLMDPQDIDTTPQESGFANIPPFYQLRLVPR
ncbi:cytochrome P450 2G1-like isoform X2 [Hemicordylus capensis]|uniref:cytochrome P450 2G1-like isoform X2 n=1 Tax=Hemicordylus capensis TaxID=884348 RepID=UPI002304AECD|nr:cytochrome P450 2G1-like isoform X2 [Hemicordylus capensis]